MSRKIYVQEIREKDSDGEELITVTTHESAVKHPAYLIFIEK